MPRSEAKHTVPIRQNRTKIAESSYDNSKHACPPPTSSSPAPSACRDHCPTLHSVSRQYPDRHRGVQAALNFILPCQIYVQVLLYLLPRVYDPTCVTIKSQFFPKASVFSILSAMMSWNCFLISIGPICPNPSWKDFVTPLSSPPSSSSNIFACTKLITTHCQLNE